MGSVLFRNRYCFYKSLYDDYLGRDFKLTFGLSCVLWMPHYWFIFSPQTSKRDLFKYFCFKIEAAFPRSFFRIILELNFTTHI